MVSERRLSSGGLELSTGATVSSAASMILRVSMPVLIPSRSVTAANASTGVLPAPAPKQLLYGSPGSYYDVRDGGAGLHHIGVWVDDVTKVNQDLVSQGYTVELAGASPEEGYGAFTYVRSPGGVLFEPESGLHGSKERFERWYAGGSLF
jgi:hypothetical protein